MLTLCAGSGSKYLRWGLGKEEPERKRGQYLNGAPEGSGGQRKLAESRGGRLQDWGGFSLNGSSGVSPNAGQPLGCSSVLPADGSVCMRTKAKTAPGITRGQFYRLESKKRTTILLVEELDDQIRDPLAC